MSEIQEAAGPELAVELELDGRVEINALSAGGLQRVREIVDEEISGRLDHRVLSGRGERGQHPVSAIEGLASELGRIPAPAEALTNFELEEILK